MSDSAACVQYKSACDAYGGAGAITLGYQTAQGAPQPVHDHSGGGLPFTGFDILLLTGGALIALGAGLFLRWTTNER